MCATTGNKYPKAMLRNCWSRHVERMLKHYSPGTLVLMGAEGTVGEFLRKAQSVLPSMHAVRIAHYAHREGKAYEARSEEHTSELQSLMRISYAVFCLKKKNCTKNS